MSAGQPSGAGRRLSPEETERGRQLFAEGRSEREVAAALHVGRGTAHRLRERLAAETEFRQPLAESGPEEPPVTEHEDQAATVAPADEDEAQLAQLLRDRDELAATVATYEGRAESSRTAVAELERERIETLAAGRDAQPLRSRRRDAEEDARDSADAAGLVRGHLAGIDQQIAAVQQRIQIAALGAELADAIAERDVVLAGTGERQRTAVLAVRTAAEEFTAALADEQAAVGRVEQLAAQIALGGDPVAVPPAVSTRLSVHPDMANGDGPLSLSRALFQAREGQVRKVAILLAEAFGYLPPSPAELAEEAERRRRLVEDGARAEAEWKRRSHQPAPPVVRHMPEHLGASYGVDARGNPLPPPSPAEMERRSRPEPARPVGWLGGQPFPG